MSSRPVRVGKLFTSFSLIPFKKIMTMNGVAECYGRNEPRADIQGTHGNWESRGKTTWGLGE